MYSKHAVTLLTQQFWTSFGQYMAPVLSAEGEKINWVNYKTGIRYIRFTMQSVNNTATISIEFSNPDIVVQQYKFDQLTTYKKQFIQKCGDDWQWQKTRNIGDNKTISSITASIKNVSVLNQSDWPEIISFFKPRLICLDNFWSNFKFALQY